MCVVGVVGVVIATFTTPTTKGGRNRVAGRVRPATHCAGELYIQTSVIGLTLQELVTQPRA
jgi:hypothetical protein